MVHEEGVKVPGSGVLISANLIFGRAVSSYVLAVLLPEVTHLHYGVGVFSYGF